jgi:hypothetical protein
MTKSGTSINTLDDLFCRNNTKCRDGLEESEISFSVPCKQLKSTVGLSVFDVAVVLNDKQYLKDLKLQNFLSLFSYTSADMGPMRAHQLNSG